jgi:hypothetical protein
MCDEAAKSVDFAAAQERQRLLEETPLPCNIRVGDRMFVKGTPLIRLVAFARRAVALVEE